MTISKTDVTVCPKCGGTHIKQDEDVLDTWFSSALWPFSTLSYPEMTEDLKYFYPTDVLVTGYDIIFFWVARMIFSGLEHMKRIPFKDVLIHGLVRDAQGRKMTEKKLGAMRRGIGMIFQHFNLLDRSTVFENIAYPLRYTGMKKADIEARVFELLDLVDLRDKADVYPSQLSGGQKQRVAIARALANKPRVLLSDEATSALDPDATEAILNLLRDLNRKLGLTIVLITHEMAVIKSICQRVAVMENGRVVEEGDVYDIFAHPRAAITRKFVSSASALSKVDKLMEEGSTLVRPTANQKLVRLTFHKDCVGEHVISTVSRDFGVDINIVLANVEVIEDNPLGGMIALLGGEEKQVAAALNYLNENHVYTEVIADGSI